MYEVTARKFEITELMGIFLGPSWRTAYVVLLWVYSAGASCGAWVGGCSFGGASCLAVSLVRVACGSPVRCARFVFGGLHKQARCGRTVPCSRPASAPTSPCSS